MAKKPKKTAVKKTSTKAKTKVLTKAKPVKATAKKPSPSASRIVEYKLFIEDSAKSLEDQVNAFIKKGWSPIGGVVLHQGHSTFTQAMVRHEI